MEFHFNGPSRLPMRRRRRYMMEGYQDATATGIAVADSIFSGAARPIYIGVVTGVSVWLVTRILDRIFKVTTQ